MKKPASKPGAAVFLDRDGVLNALVYHQEAGVIDAPFTESQFKLLPKVPEAIRELNRLGLLVVVVSNQPGVGKGHLTSETLRTLERKLLLEVERAKGRIDAIYYCLHHPEAKVKQLRKKCACRKPGIGMLQAAARRFNLSLKDCFMVGDGLTDIAAGRRAGCQTIFVGRWKCEICQFIENPQQDRPDFVAQDLWAAVEIIREQVRNGKPVPLAVACRATPQPLAERQRARLLASASVDLGYRFSS